MSRKRSQGNWTLGSRSGRLESHWILQGAEYLRSSDRSVNNRPSTGYALEFTTYLDGDRARPLGPYLTSLE